MVVEKLTEELHIKVSKRTIRALNRMRARTGVTVSWLVRHAVNDYLSRKGAFTYDQSR